MNEKIINQIISILVKLVLIGTCLVLVLYTGKSYYDYKVTALKTEIARQADFAPTMQKTLKELDCLATNIYYEAGNQSFEGKVAVAQVTLNRTADGRFGKSVCDVVYSKTMIHGKLLCQFSWVCENKRKMIPLHDKQWQESQDVAKKVLLEHFKLPSLTQSLYFHADYIRPNWRKEKIAKIGQHIFYKE